MGNYLLKYIMGGEEEQVKKVFDRLSILKGRTDNFNKLIKDDNIILGSEVVGVFYDFLYAYSEIYDYMDNNKLLEEVKKTFSNNEIVFWNSVIQYFDITKIIRNQTVFLKNMQMSEFTDIVSYTFQNYICYNGSIKKYKKWNEDEIKITIRTINTFLECAIDDFTNFEDTVYTLDLRFQFGKEKYEYIWNMFKEVKLYLMLKNITEKLNKESYIRNLEEDS